MKKYVIKSLILGMMLTFGAADANAYVDREVAVISIMNKAAGKTHTVSVPVGETAKFEKLSMTVRSCKQTDPFQATDFFAFIEVTAANELIFSNWMSRNAPGDAPLQNADYDLWLVQCQ